MPHKSSHNFTHDAYLELLISILSDGYTDEVRLFTRSIQTNPDAVLDFEIMFDMLNDEARINWKGTPSQELSMELAIDRHEEMETFLKEIGRPIESFVSVINHGPETTFEIGWSDHVGDVVWDRWTLEVDDPVIAFADIGFLFDTKEYRCAPKPTEKPKPPLYRYHPERFKAYRDYAELVGKLYRQEVEPASGMMTLEQLTEAMNLVVTEQNHRAAKFPRKLRESHPHPTLVIEAEETLATAYGRFVQAGRQIMDFPPALTEMLAKTDVGDIPLNSIKLPYASQYLHFGAQAELELEPGWMVDGAYVEQRGVDGDVRFTITATPTDHNLSGQWFLFPEAEYTQDIVGGIPSMNLSTAIDTVLLDRLERLQTQKSKSGGDITKTMQAALSEKGIAIPDDATVVNIAPKMAALRDDTTRRRHPVYKTALQLVVNALCYVSAYPDDISTTWPEGTPDSLKRKVMTGKDKERTRAKSKLASMGYIPVHICGKQISEQRGPNNVQPKEHGQVASHWRRGHWRNQVHGPSRLLRKLIWVMPVLVGSKDHEELESGHLYLVS